MKPIEAVKGALRLAARWRPKALATSSDATGAERVLLAMMRTSTHAARLMSKFPIPVAEGDERHFLERARSELGVMREHISHGSRPVDRAMVEMIDATADLLARMLTAKAPDTPRELNVGDTPPTKVTF